MQYNSVPYSIAANSSVPVPPLEFVALLARRFTNRRNELLEYRQKIEKNIEKGIMPRFLPETEHIRRSQWQIRRTSKDNPILKRTVDIVLWKVFERKEFTRALESTADGIQFDFDDSYSPTWNNNLAAQFNLVDALLRSAHQKGGKRPAIIVRPRSLNLNEDHVLVDGEPVPGAIFDFGVWMYNYHQISNKYNLNVEEGPYFYIPKLENHLEARLWNDIITFTEQHFNMVKGSIKTLVLIENILAVFEMDEILYEMRDHCLGLNTGRWDYVFSFIKKFRNNPAFVTPERSQIGMDQTFLATWERLLIDTCRNRGAIATGGMAPQLPHSDMSVMAELHKQVFEGKCREAAVGLDGALVADAAFVEDVQKAFASTKPKKFSLPKNEKELEKRLLAVPKGNITDIGVAKNVEVVVHYIESWLRGEGGCPLNGILEDLATAEITRTQLWQWIKHNAITKEGHAITYELVKDQITALVAKKRAQFSADAWKTRKFEVAQDLALKLMDTTNFYDFMPSLLYEAILSTKEAKL